MPAKAGAARGGARSSISAISAKDALTFYRTIFGNELTEFRLIHPRKEGKDKTLHYWGWLGNEEQLKALEEYNAKGYGVFAVINRCATHVEERCKAAKGARDEDITGVRAVFVDLDRETTPGANKAKLEAAPLRPSLIVCSSLPHKLQAYWKVADLPVGDFERVQKALAAFFHSDPSICNPARVMRVPGFFHTKAEPVLSKLLRAL